MRRFLLTFFVAIATMVGFNLPAANATSTSVTGNLTVGVVTYTNPRTITVSGSNISFRKTDGPEMALRWYKCGNTGVAGSFVYFENPDPTATKLLGTGFIAGTKFCLQSQGVTFGDTFTGTLWWA